MISAHLKIELPATWDALWPIIHFHASLPSANRTCSPLQHIPNLPFHPYPPSQSCLRHFSPSSSSAVDPSSVSQMALRIQTTARCLGHVGAAFIKPDGGRPNLGAKAIATMWYLLVLPDAQARLNRQMHRKRVPWYAASRLFGIALAATNIVTMPLSWALLGANKRNASRIVSLGVLLNPPSLTLSLLFISELSSTLLNRTCAIVRGTGRLVTAPFKSKSHDDKPPTKSE